jgi:hypothetical protein
MFKFTPKTIPNQIFLIGCGGTGSRLVPLLVQFIASITKNKSPRGWLDNPTIYIVDDDTVETKNLARQNFIAADVGKSKAAVLANRYGKAYGVNVVPVMKRVEGSFTTFTKDVPGTPTFVNSMVIFGVDTVKARRDILRTIGNDPALRQQSHSNAGYSPFIIDAGNEDSFGQVRFFNFVVADDQGDSLSNGLTLPAMSPVVTNIPAIPIDFRYYIDAVDMPGQGSCADLDQTLAINASMATEIMDIVQNYFYVRPMKFNFTSRSLDGDRMTMFNTAKWLKGLAARNAEEYVAARNLLGSRHSVIGVYHLIETFIAETEVALEEMRKPKVEAEQVEAPKKKSRSKKAVAGETLEVEAIAHEVPPLPEPVAARPVEPQVEAITEELIPGEGVEDDMDF